MSEWRRTTLGEIAEVVGGGTPKTSEPSYWGGDVVWLTPTEVVKADGGVVSESERMITLQGLSSSGARLLPKGAVLVTTRASVGFVALAGRAVTTNQGFQSLVPSEALLPRFLVFWVQANRNEFTSRAGGSTFAEISRRNVASIPITVPPLGEQRRIVDLIGALDTHLVTCVAELRASDRVKTALLEELFNRANGGEERLLSDVVALDYGKALKAAHRKHGEVPVFGAAGRTGTHDASTVNANHIVVGRKGVDSRSTLATPIRNDAGLEGDDYSGWGGAGAVRWAHGPHWIIDTAYSARSLLNLPESLVFWLLVRADLPRIATKTTLPGLARDLAYSVPVFIPNDFRPRLGALEATDELQFRLLVELVQLREVRAIVLNRLLTGVSAIPTRYDALMESA